MYSFPNFGGLAIIPTLVFLVVIHGCESWTVKKAEHQTTDTFELWCWRRLLKVPWTARRSNQSILKEINPEYSLEGLILKLKLQYFGCLMLRAGSLEKTLMLGKIEGRREGDDREWDGWMASPTQWTWIWASWTSPFWEIVKDREAWHAAVHGAQRVRHDLAVEQQQQRWYKMSHTSC